MRMDRICGDDGKQKEGAAETRQKMLSISLEKSEWIGSSLNNWLL